MSIKIQFLGAAGNVTGSCSLIDTGKSRILIDCGLYQEREFRERNWAPFAVNPPEIDALLLTHAHLDHCGLIPKLVKEGFNGKIFCTKATADIAPIVLFDSAHLQAEDIKQKAKRHQREGRQGPHPLEPLYNREDVDTSLPLFTPLEYSEETPVSEGISAKFIPAGHIIGASVINLTINIDGVSKSIIFSGDIGRKNKPIIEDPENLPPADYVVMESTYGDRTHADTGDIQTQLADIINSTVKRGGKIIIPCFAVERSQEVLYRLNQLFEQKLIPSLKVFLDSPMAIKVTEVFKKHKDLYDEEMVKMLDNGSSPFSFKGLTFTKSSDESKSINDIAGSAVIMAGSGMCTGGRIKHHLLHNIENRANTILFVGYQASGTLGRIIVEGAREIRVLGTMRQVKADIRQIHGFSGHADKNELLAWLKTLKNPPRRVFITHGGANITAKFAAFITEQTGWPATAPDYRDTITLD